MKYLKTEVGQQAFKARSASMSTRQRSAFILFDGVRTGAQVLAMTVGLGVTQNDIDHLTGQGFLTELPGSATLPDPFAASPPRASVNAGLQAGNGGTRTPQERYRMAMPIATQLTASLGLRGFRLNLAVEAASGYEELLLLLPKIQAAVGVKACHPLEQALNA
jgi:hypothetical protein